MSAPTTPNAELAYKVLDQVDAHPETWNQGVWDCGTAACFAGWAVRLSGGTSEMRFSDIVVVDGPSEILHQGVDEAAMILLGSDGLTGDGEDLFGADNTRADLGRLVAEIFGPRPESCGYTLPHPAHDWTKLADDERPADQAAHCQGVPEPVALDYDDVPPNAGTAS